MRAFMTAVALCALAGCSGEFPIDTFPGGTTILPAENFQTEIMEIDLLVFADEEIGESGREDLGVKLENLASRINEARGESTFLALEARELRSLARRMRRIAASHPVPQPLRDHWMRIRSTVFDDRAWFARSAEDLADPTFVAMKPAAPAKPVAPEVTEHETPVKPPPAYQRGTGPFSVLEGRWSIRALSMNGRPTTDPEMSGSWWIFQGDQLAIHTANGETTGRYRFQVVIDERGHALRVDSLPGSQIPEHGWMIYERSGNELHVAFFDGLRERPAGFEPDPSASEPELVVLTLQRSP